ncbi:J domain-containing protein [Treponema saccharophilum]|uniref:J domain-containing protein n=1 Tax=Treponema saccharophilum TaxID=165 RepID=UPI003864D427
MDFYEKFGDLLSEAIAKSERGPEREQKEEDPTVTRLSSDDKAKAKSFSFAQFAGGAGSAKTKARAFDFAQFAKMAQEAAKTEPRVQIYKFSQLVIPQNVLTALNTLGIPTNAEFDEAKKIYREKLLYYHPDKWQNTPYLEQAKSNTLTINNAWEIVEWWFVAR